MSGRALTGSDSGNLYFDIMSADNIVSLCTLASVGRNGQACLYWNFRVCSGRALQLICIYLYHIILLIHLVLHWVFHTDIPLVFQIWIHGCLGYKCSHYHMDRYSLHDVWVFITWCARIGQLLAWSYFSLCWNSFWETLLYDEHVNIIMEHIDGLVQNCSISSALAMEILQSCPKLSIYIPNLASYLTFILLNFFQRTYSTSGPPFTKTTSS